LGISDKSLPKLQNSSMDPLEYVILCGENAFEANTKICQEMNETTKLFKSAVGRLNFSNSENFGNYH